MNEVFKTAEDAPRLLSAGKTVNPRQLDPAEIRRSLGYITDHELYALLGITTKTGQSWQSAGTLPAHFKLGRQKVYKLAEVEKWIARHRVRRGTL